MTRNFYCWKVPSDQKSTVGLAKNLLNVSEKKRKELKMTGHFYSEKDRRTRKSTVGLAKNL